jgi:hypothetical protein
MIRALPSMSPTVAFICASAIRSGLAISLIEPILRMDPEPKHST